MEHKNLNPNLNFGSRYDLNPPATFFTQSQTRRLN